MCVSVCSKSNLPSFSTRTAGLVQILALHLLGCNLAVTILLLFCFFVFFFAEASVNRAEQTLNVASSFCHFEERLYW